jgi:hypothetical protein
MRGISRENGLLGMNWDLQHSSGCSAFCNIRICWHWLYQLQLRTELPSLIPMTL